MWCLPALAAEAGIDDPRVRPRADLIEVIGELASEWYGRPSDSLTVFGVTGTNGKTSTVQLLAQAWAALGHRAATIGTLGAAIHGEELALNGYTTPPVTRLHELLAEFRDAGVTHLAMEVSSHALEERRVDGVRFDAVHFSNLTRDHLDYHGTMEHYAAQKAKIYGLRGKGLEMPLRGSSTGDLEDRGLRSAEGADRRGLRSAEGASRNPPLAIGNLDDPFVRECWHALDPARPRIGLSSQGREDAGLRAEDLRFARDRTTFDLVVASATGGDDRSVELATGLIGRFNVDNLLAVVAELLREGVPLATIAALVPGLTPPFGRMWRIHPDPSLPMVVVDAGHTPDAMRQALTAIAEYGYDRVISVFGATGSRDPGKRPEMARIVEERSDVVIVTDDDVHDEDGDAIVAQLLTAMAHPERATVERDRGSAVELAIRQAGSGDVVMLLGKGHEPMQIVAKHVEIPYSDIETAERVLARLRDERS